MGYDNGMVRGREIGYYNGYQQGEEDASGLYRMIAEDNYSQGYSEGYYDGKSGKAFAP